MGSGLQKNHKLSCNISLVNGESMSGDGIYITIIFGNNTLGCFNVIV